MRMVQQVVFAVIATTLIFDPILLAAAQSAQTTRTKSTAQRLAQLDQVTALLEELKENIDKSQFDVDALLEKLDFDQAAIVEFVKNEIYFEQYAGLLRGAEGTLRGRAGNALDQSVLLAHLLKQAGFEARILRGTIGTNQAIQVLGQIRQPRQARKPVGKPAEVKRILLELGWAKVQVGALADAIDSFVSGTSAVIESPALKASMRTSNELLEELQKADFEFDGDGSSRKLVDEAKDYYWVQYQTEAAGEWVDTHPVFAGRMEFLEPTYIDLFVDTIPPELQHLFGIEVTLETATGGRLEERTLIEPVMIPTSNLSASPITLTNVPEQLIGKAFSELDDIDELIQDNAYFIPLVEGTGQTGPLFDLYGNTIDGTAAGSGAGFFAKVNQAFRDAIGGIAENESAPVLTSQAIKIHLKRPDGTTEVFSRRTFDAIGAAARRNDSPPADVNARSAAMAPELVNTQSIMVSTGDIPPAFALYYGVGRVLEIINRMRTALVQRDGSSADLRAVKSAVSTHWSGHVSMQSIFGLSREISSQHSIYRPAPGVFLWGSGLSSQHSIIELADIVANPIRAVDFRTQIPELDKAMALQAGVWETYVEGVGIRAPGDRLSTISSMARSQEQGIPTVVVRSLADLDKVNLDPDARSYALDDLDNGYALVMPSRPVETDEMSVWWRVHQQTGTTLGMAGNGRGLTLVEYAAIGVTAVGFIVGVLSCASSSYALESSGAAAGLTDSDVAYKFWCCVASTVLFTSAGLIIAFALTLVPGGVSVISGAAVSIGYDTISLFAPSILCPQYLQ